MEIDKLSPEIGVCAQILPRDLPQAHALGYRTVICNRPDGEAEDQPLYESIATAAGNSGMKAHYIPVPGSGVEDAQVDALTAIWPGLEKPVLMFCRSGGRSRALAKAALDL